MSGPPQGGILGILPIPVGLGGSLASGGVPSAVDQWKMNEGSGTTFLESVSSNNATTNSTWSGSLATFNGSEKATTTNNQAFDFEANQTMSISAWINPTSNATTEAIFSHENVSANFQGWSLLLLSGAVYMSWADGSSFISTQTNSPVAANALQNIVVTYNGSQLSAGVLIYINGVLQPTTSGGGSISTTSSTGLPAYIGARSDGSIGFTGIISDVQIWNVTLTPTQVTAVYSAGNN